MAPSDVNSATNRRDRISFTMEAQLGLTRTHLVAAVSTWKLSRIGAN
jgi:hypothetical protein